MQTSFELILDDTSPVINYYPFAETLGAPNLAAGWNSYYTQSGFLSELGQTGEGMSLHVTSLDGAELTIQWFGTGIFLYGRVLKAAYSISVDGGRQTIGIPKGDLLAEVQELEATQHIIALIAHPSPNNASDPSSYVAFDHAALNISTVFTGATVSSEFVDAGSSRWLFSGNWAQLSDPILNSGPFQEYFLSATQGDKASIFFTGSAVAVTGIRNTTMGQYNVTLDGATTTYDGHSNWLEPSTLFLQAGLDELSRHSLTITNVDDASVAIAGVNVTHVEGGDFFSDGSSHGLPAGTTAALILAGLIAVVGFSFLLVCVYLRRHRTSERRPRFAVEPGLSTSSYLKDFTNAIGSSPRRRQSWSDKHELSTFAGEARRDRGDLRAEQGSEVLMASNHRPITVDPASPLPYLRIPISSSHVQMVLNSSERQEHDKEYRRNSQSGQRRRGSRRDTLDQNVKNKTSMVIEVPETPNPSDGSSSNTVTERRVRAHRTSKRSTSLDPAQHLHVDIPSPVPSPNYENDTSNMLLATPTPTRQERSSLLVSPVKSGTRYRSRRSSFGSSHRFSMIPDSPSSLSTMQFGRPRRHSLSGDSEGTSYAESSLRGGVGTSVGQWKMQPTFRPPPAPIKPSNWKPPW